MSGEAYTPLHPSIFSYNPEHLGAKLVAGGPPSAIVEEKAEQLYMFELFTPEYCKLLIEEAEHCGKWKTGVDEESHPYDETGQLVDVCEPDTTQHLKHMTGLDEVFTKIIRAHLQPLMEQLWVTFKLKKISKPYLLKYSPDAVKEMALHHDLETVTLVVYLNDEFEGGGTFFPRWNFTTSKAQPGTAIIYPGGLSHEHAGLAITSGRRYLLCSSFY